MEGKNVFTLNLRLICRKYEAVYSYFYQHLMENSMA